MNLSAAIRWNAATGGRSNVQEWSTTPSRIVERSGVVKLSMEPAIRIERNNLSSVRP